MNIGLIGRARSGKDTVGRILLDHGGYERVAFADPLKAAALKLDPLIHTDHPSGVERLSEILATPNALTWEDAKDMFPEVRRILQELGAAMRAIDPEFWLRAGLARAEEVNRQTGRPAVVTDVRYPNEADSLKRAGFHLIYVDRPGIPHLTHESEGALGPVDADFVIENDGSLDDLKERVRTVYHQIHTDESRRHYARAHS